MNRTAGLIRFYIKLSISSLVILTTMLIAAHSAVIGQPPNPMMIGFADGCEGKPRPCWHGVVPGITHVEAALQRFEDLAFSVSQRVSPQPGQNAYFIPDPRNDPGCVTILMPSANNSTILRLICPGLRLGDIMTAFGAPDTAYNGLLYYHFGLTLLAYELSPYSEVETIFLTLSNPVPLCSPAWRGFARWWRYRRWAEQEPAC
jgi:hypothetical protein